MKVGSKVRVSHGEESILGTVVLHSENLRSLALQIDGLLDGHVGFMAVGMDGEGNYRTIISNHLVRVEEVE